MLDRWSQRHLGAWADSLEGLVTGDALDAWIDSLMAADTSSAASRPASERRWHLELQAGLEVEGLDQSFGSVSLAPLTSMSTPAAEIPLVEADSSLLPARFVERTSAPLALLGFRAHSAGDARHDAWLEAESRWGEERADATVEAYESPRGGPLHDASVRDLFSWDRDENGVTSRQNLLYLRWSPRLAGGPWRLGLRGSMDVSRSDDADIEIDPQGGTAAADTSAWISFLNYERYTARLEISRLGWSSSTLGVELARKQIAPPGAGSYRDVALRGNQSWIFAPGMLDLDGETRRRRYDDDSVLLGSFWESELRVRWLGTGIRWWFEGGLNATGTWYDDSSSDNDFLALSDDQVTMDAELLLHRRLIGEPSGAEVPGWSWEAGWGPVAELLRQRSGSGDALSLGMRAVSSLQAPGRRGGWVELSLEVGRRDYGASADSERVIFEGYSLSLAQTDYAYGRVSCIGGGELPWAFSWEGYLSYDEEWHTASVDDARLISFSLALKRRFALF